MLSLVVAATTPSSPAPAFDAVAVVAMLCHRRFFQGSGHRGADIAQILDHFNAVLLQSRDLARVSPGAAFDDGARVAHAASRRSRASRDESEDGLVHVIAR